MSKAPAFQLYVQDFLMGTRFLTAEETGALILLLCEQWDKGFIENDPAYLKKITKISAKKLENVLKKFERRKNKLVNTRLEQEQQKLKEYIDKQAINGSKGGRPKKGLGSSGLTQTEPKKTSSTSISTSTSTPISTSSSISSSTSTSNNGGSGLFVPPTTTEIKSFFKENGYREDIALKAYDYYSAANWIDGNGNTIKNWKQKIISVWFTDDHKIPPYQPIQSFMVKL